ncbi:hypothetical protein EMIHUDRAFT_247852 [Emiliania huxleyi CCMP1516]|uniref:Uncharacterized protein n=2 Tax=Emiliania huxleyi TaxID=2903 RepID=A0A0D3IJT1_EMIH1|nr:hypothetical protein EMIHUDRAFT_247852 [Emiliania huxleyi CCMP1516]EOD11516.1 hypothetical protein EMIHUDRAFT_247852 [Emiliania huxleyi CCMP1516]|eukprot:XP_005763945.1 hypothetical protein EMIHUDRAFT_247852 [Emiliania huxleyi CCMP1516]
MICLVALSISLVGGGRAWQKRLTTPYSRAPDCTAQLDASKLAAIEELVAQRLAAKLRRDFAESDALLQRLLDSGVRVTDDHRLWRSDDRPFVVPYRQEGGGIPRLGTGGTTRIEALVLERDLFTAAGVKRRCSQQALVLERGAAKASGGARPRFERSAPPS